MNKPFPWKGTSWNIILVVAGLLLGFILAAQWDAAPVVEQNDPSYARENLADIIQQLELEQESLKKQISTLRAQVAQEQDRIAQDTQLLQGLQTELETQRVLAGVYALRGRGVRVTLADSHLEIPPHAKANLYIVHDYDVRDVVNSLWAQGAEAISINNERLVSTTSIYCVGNTIMVNATRLASPYTIQAIGDEKRLAEINEPPTTLLELQTRARTYGLQFKIDPKQDIHIPAYRGSFGMGNAQPGS